jgi:hypothetical protein
VELYLWYPYMPCWLGQGKLHFFHFSPYICFISDFSCAGSVFVGVIFIADGSSSVVTLKFGGHLQKHNICVIHRYVSCLT